MGSSRSSKPGAKSHEAPASFDAETLIQPATHAAYRTYVERTLGRHGVPAEHREDLAQDVLADAAVRRHEYDPALGMVRQWLSAFARYAALGYFRTRQRRPGDLAGEALEQEPPSSDLSPEQGLYARNLVDHLCEALSEALSEPLRETFRLYVEGYTYREIAEKTGLSLDKVKSRIEKANRAQGGVLGRLDADGEGVPDVRLCAAPWALAGMAGHAMGNLGGEPPGGEPPGSEPSTPDPMPPSAWGWRAALMHAGVGLSLPAAVIAIALAWSPSHCGAFAFEARAEPAIAPTNAGDVPAVSAPPGRPSPGVTEPATVKASINASSPMRLVPRSGHGFQEADLLLRSAREALQNGSPSEALALAREHRRRFPMHKAAERKTLVVEARAAQAHARP